MLDSRVPALLQGHAYTWELDEVNSSELRQGQLTCFQKTQQVNEFAIKATLQTSPKAVDVPSHNAHAFLTIAPLVYQKVASQNSCSLFPYEFSPPPLLQTHPIVKLLHQSRFRNTPILRLLSLTVLFSHAQAALDPRAKAHFPALYVLHVIVLFSWSAN